MRLLLRVCLLLLAVGPACAADPNALWNIVHGRCVPNQVLNNSPTPCAAVMLGHGEPQGHALLKDIVGKSQYLLIPTLRVTGIESPDILRPDAPNYFAAAWAARTEVEARLGRAMPADTLSLTINSPFGRSQSQLHIHIDCLRADVAEQLRRRAAEVGDAWAPFPEALLKHAYIARRVAAPTLAEANPFRLLAASLADPAEMAQYSLAVAGATLDGQPGFLLLATKVDVAAANFASSEELQDHDCAVAR